MNAGLINESLIAAIAHLSPETRNRILADFNRELRKRDDRLARLERAAKMKKERIPYRVICRTLNLSMSDVSKAQLLQHSVSIRR